MYILQEEATLGGCCGTVEQQDREKNKFTLYNLYNFYYHKGSLIYNPHPLCIQSIVTFQLSAYCCWAAAFVVAHYKCFALYSSGIYWEEGARRAFRITLVLSNHGINYLVIVVEL